MADPFRAITRSPLDDLPPRLSVRLRLTLTAVISALVAGAATLGVLAALPDAEPGEAVPIYTVPAEPPPPPQGLPPGYVDTGAGYGVRVEWLMQLPDELLVGVSSATPSDSDAADVRPIGSTILGPTRRAIGAWRLRLADGRTVEHESEYLDDGAIGMLTISFPVSGLQEGDAAGIEVTPAVGAGLRIEQSRVPVVEFPVELGDLGLEIKATELIEAGGEAPIRSGETRLVVDRLQVGWSSGWLDWRLEGIEGVRVRLEPVITLVGDAVPPEDRAVLITDLASGSRFLQRSPAPLTPGRSGSSHLVGARPGPATYEVTALEITWTVTWARYSGEALTVPADGCSWITAAE